MSVGITPVTRDEQFAGALSGDLAVEKLPKAETNVEKYLKHAAEHGGNVYDKLTAGTNIVIEETEDGGAKISASGEVSSEDTYARAEIAAIKDGETLDSFGDVETALIGKADTTDIPTVPITAIQKNGTGITPVSGTVNITVPTQASDINAATATQGGKADTAIQGIKVNSSTVNPDANKVVNITVPTTAADVSALPDTTKYAAALSLTINSSTFVMTGQLKDQNGDNLGTAQTIDLPLESVVVNGSYNSQTKKVVLTLQNGNTIEFSVADLVSGLQTELSASNKLNPAYINYDSTHAAVTEAQREQININQTNIGKVQTQANWNTNNGVKNLLKTSFTNGEVRGVVYTLNTDGSITVKGTANSYGSTMYIFDDLIPAGNYIMSIGTAVGSGNYVTVIYSDDTQTGITGTNTTAQLSNKDIKKIYVYVAANTAIDVTIYPMLTLKSLYDAGFTDFQPYALPNTKITPELIELVDSGAKNLSPVSTGTSSVASYIVESAANLPAGDYVFCWKNSVSSGVSTVVNCYTSDNTRVVNKNEANNAVETRFITIPQDCVKFNLYTTGANQVTDLMICSKAAWDVSQKFVPYRPTYEETVEQVAENKNNILSNYGGTIDKNILNTTITVANDNDVTFTLNDDKSITVNGTNRFTTAAIPIELGSFTPVTGKTYVCKGTGDANIKIQVFDGTGLPANSSDDATFTAQAGATYSARVWIAAKPASGTQFNNLKIYPMICEQSIYTADSSYQPYILSNREASDAIQAIQSWIAAHS